MARVLAISSQVVRGHIGLSAIVPALQTLGHEVWPMPTILLSNHPGHPRAAGVRTPVERLDAMLDALEANGWLRLVDAVLTGYLPSVDHVAFAARAIERIRRHAPTATILVDPVLGDDPKGLYIEEAAAAAIRDTLLPSADVATPNRFELGWLTGARVDDLGRAAAAARRIGCPAVVVTSAALTGTSRRAPENAVAGERSEQTVLTGEQIMTVLVASQTVTAFGMPRHSQAPHGTGDLLSGLLIAHMLAGGPLLEAVARAVGGVGCAIEASVGSDELALAGHWRDVAEAAPPSGEALA